MPQQYQRGPQSPLYNRVRVKCEVCGREEDRVRNRLVPGRHIYCSNACRAIGCRKTGRHHPCWKGGVIQRPSGYLYIKVGREHPMAAKDGYVQQHRLVMSEHLGRLLTKDEVVHHVNGVKHDNRIVNLQLMASTGAHTLHHAKLRAFLRSEKEP